MIGPEEEARRRSALAAGLSDAEIGAPTGAGRATIAAWRRARGLPPAVEAPPRPAPGVLEERRRLVAAGLSDGEIARREGVSRSAIGHWRAQEGLAGGARRGESPEGPPADRTLIRELAAQGLSAAEIGRRLGRSRSRISQILTEEGLR